VQASFAWTPPSGTLGRIVDEARTRARALENRAADLEREASAVKGVPAFAPALRAASVSVIAEVKRRSPSKGWIQPTPVPAQRRSRFSRSLNTSPVRQTISFKREEQSRYQC
jgi:hypothetical protein